MHFILWFKSHENSEKVTRNQKSAAVIEIIVCAENLLTRLRVLALIIEMERM
jgi:hypothetical protein